MGATSIGNPQSNNLYAYVQNMPTDFVDPSGLRLQYYDVRRGLACVVVNGVNRCIEYIDRYWYDDGTDDSGGPGRDEFLGGGGGGGGGPQNPTQPNRNCIANAVAGGRVGGTRNIMPNVYGGNAHDGIHVEAGPGIHPVVALPAMAGRVLHAGRQSGHPDDAGYGLSVVDILLNTRIDGQRYVMTLKDMAYDTGIRRGRVTSGRIIGSVEGSANPVGETGLHVTLMPLPIYNKHIRGRASSVSRSSVPVNQLMDAARDPRSPFRCQ